MVQVGGLGTRLMNHLKEELLRQGYQRFLVYADDTALSFFLNAGCANQLTIQKADYDGRIGVYDEATLMECMLQPAVPYTRIPLLIRTARATIMSAWTSSSDRRRKADEPPPDAPALKRRCLLPALVETYLGEELAAEVKALGRTLNDPVDLSAVIGTRLAPA